MPLTPTAAKGVVGLMIEGNNGMQTLLAATPVIATVSGISAPTGSTGMKIYVRITNWTASGTFTINGTATPGADATVNVPSPTVQQLQSAQSYSFDYVSVGAYTTITNITTTGLTNGTITVLGIQASKFNIPVTAFKSSRKVPLYSPNEHNGLMARDKKLIATHNETSIESMDSDFYGDLSLYWVYLLIGTPTWSTIPAAPLSVVAAATISASMTIAGQPTAPGMKLIITVSTFTGNPSFTITGTSWGLTVTETITPTANGTLYSANVYSALTSVGGATNATTIAITGVFGWKGVVTEEATRSTAAVEHFDGSASWTHPYVAATDGDMTISTKGEAKLTLKGIAQDRLACGDRTTTPLNTSRVTSIGTPLSDMPLAGWQTAVWLDTITSTSQTTLFTNADEEIKITLKTPTEAHWTFTNLQTFTRAYPIKPELTCDMTYDVLDLLQYEQFRENLKQYLVVQLFGRYIGSSAGTAFYEGWTWTLPGRYDGEYAQEGDPGKGNTFAKPKWRTEYDPAIGGSYQLTIITQNPPSYNV